MTASTNLDAYPLWADETIYSRAYHVDQRHPAADDGNDGGPEAPLRSIQAAVDRVQPGERVVVHSGLYRECIQPRRGGAGPGQMIAIEAAAGAEAVVCGSRVLESAWSRPRHWDLATEGQGLTASSSQRVWLTTLPDDCFAADYDPFRLCNCEPHEVALMEWMAPVAGEVPFSLKRGLLYQDGQRLTQVAHPGDVARQAGSFWIDRDGRHLHVHPLKDGPQGCRFEVAVQDHLLCPDTVGLAYIAVRGLVFEHCANGFLRAGCGAVTTRGGGFWIIEDCTIREVNSAGLEFGDAPFEYRDPNPLNGGPKSWPRAGHVIARRNHIHDCGTAGIRCLAVTEGRVLANRIERCGWQHAELYFECAGIKLLVNAHTLVAGNHISGCVDACGIWMDWNNQHSRVTRNLIRDHAGQQGAIFIEASNVPNRIDHNLLWQIDGPGIFGGEASEQEFDHNLIGSTTAAPLLLIRHSDRNLKGNPLTCERNAVHHNLFVDARSYEVTANSHRFEANTYVFTIACPQLDLAAWQERGFDRDAVVLLGDCGLDGYRDRLHWNLDGPLRADCGPLPLVGHAGSVDWPTGWVETGPS